jgi:hypothetical protein
VNLRPLGNVSTDVVPALVDALRFELDGMPKPKASRELVHPLTATWTVGEVVIAKGTRTREGHGYETVEAIARGRPRVSIVDRRTPVRYSQPWNYRRVRLSHPLRMVVTAT